jgi:hypothetical protein
MYSSTEDSENAFLSERNSSGFQKLWIFAWTHKQFTCLPKHKRWTEQWAALPSFHLEQPTCGLTGRTWGRFLYTNRAHPLPRLDSGAVFKNNAFSCVQFGISKGVPNKVQLQFFLEYLTHLSSVVLMGNDHVQIVFSLLDCWYTWMYNINWSYPRNRIDGKSNMQRARSNDPSCLAMSNAKWCWNTRLSPVMKSVSKRGLLYCSNS